MTTTVLAHFDGKRSLVLNEPVDLPVGTPLRVQVEAVPHQDAVADDDLLSSVIVGLDPAIVEAIASDPEFNVENM
jgi:hypothetical protein